MTAKFGFGDVQYSALNHTPAKRVRTLLLALVFTTSLFIIYSLLPVKTHPSNTDPVITEPADTYPSHTDPVNHDPIQTGRVNADTINPPPAHCAVTGEGINEKKKILGKNWIVVTTVNEPTDAMELLCSLEGWNVVVVADTKSPKDWKCGSCVYLSVEDQQCLGYRIVDVIPYRAYTRKNIGYLWAIQQGATKVFDTDDDNLPTGKDIIFESPTDNLIAYRSDNTTGKSVNIYSHFGRPDIWPRGFPLEDIDVRRPAAYLPEYTSIPEPARSALAPPMLVQQGLADLDPDVDAIFRLTQVQELKEARFCKKSPSLRLSPGTFSPFNSQNTLFSYDALWGLLLPVTVSFRVCDIWRGYWVQRLLWDVNGSLGFTKPTVDQIRNAHNYHADYMDELQIYSQTSAFIDFLADWSSTSADLDTRIIDLMKAMAENKFIEALDVELAERWVKDLRSANYVFPKVSPYNAVEVKSHFDEQVEPRLWLQTSRKLANDALKECQQDAETDPTMSRIRITEPQKTDYSARFKDVLLVVNFNHPNYTVIDPFLEIHRPYFPNIQFYGPEVPENFKDRVEEIPYDKGDNSYRTLAWAMKKYPDYAGYLYTNDDTVLNVHQLAEFDQDKVWRLVPNATSDVHERGTPEPENDHWQWWRPHSELVWNDTSFFTAEQLKRIETFTGIQGPVDIRSFSDALYVPKRISVELGLLLEKFLKYEVFLELAVGLALIAVEPTKNWVDWAEMYLWFDDRDHWREYLSPGLAMLHPVKVALDPKAKYDVVRWIESTEAQPQT